MTTMIHWAGVRISFYTERFIRIESSCDEVFEDRLTLTVEQRQAEDCLVETDREGEWRIARTEHLEVRYCQPELGNLTDSSPIINAHNFIIIIRNPVGFSTSVTWRPGQVDAQNLGGTLRTLDGMNGGDEQENPNHVPPELLHARQRTPVPTPDGLLSRSGWAVVDDSQQPVLDQNNWPVARRAGVQDWYFLGYGLDYCAALREAQVVFGQQPLLPVWAYGYWYSRYWAYTDGEIEEMVTTFQQYDIPLSVMVIDMDWHQLGWGGNTWCQDQYPDHQALTDWLHQRGVKVALNLHPADGVSSMDANYYAFTQRLGPERVATNQATVPSDGIAQSFYQRIAEHGGDAVSHVNFDCTDPVYMQAYFEALHRPLESSRTASGVDLWWLDWQQGTTSAITGLDPLPWLNYLHWHDQQRNPAKQGLRPMNFSRFGGLGSGRYPIGFSGDTHATWDSLQFQIGFTTRAGNVLFGNWSHDIGGFMHTQERTPELYLRWLQFGVFTPVLRTHAGKKSINERRVFHYPEPYKSLMMAAIRQRYQLIPYIVTQQALGAPQGLSLCRPMYWWYPTREEAYQADTQFFFGEDVLIAPVVTPLVVNDDGDDGDDGGHHAHHAVSRRTWLPPGVWYDRAHGGMLTGDCWYEADYSLAETPVFIRSGAVIPGMQLGRASDMQLGMPDTIGQQPLEWFITPVAQVDGSSGSGVLYEDDGLTTAYRDGAHVTVQVDQQYRDGDLQVTINPAVGSYDGYQPQRHCRLVIPGYLPPNTVRVGEAMVTHCVDPLAVDSDVACWHCDPRQLSIVIDLPSIDLRQETTVQLSGLRTHAASPALPPQPLHFFNRLLALARRLATVSPGHALFHEERLLIRAAQTPRRIAYRPTTAVAELTALPDLLRRIPNSLQLYADLYQQRHGEKPCPQSAIIKEILNEFNDLNTDLF